MHPFFFRFFNINAIKEKNDKDRECETAPSIQAESSEDKDSLESSNEISQNDPKGEDNPRFSVTSSYAVKSEELYERSDVEKTL